MRSTHALVFVVLPSSSSLSRLLEELKRKSSPDSRGYADLLASIAQVGEVALHVNETIRHREQNEALRQLEKAFALTAQTGFQRINLRDREPPRTLIKEGLLKRLTRKGHESYYLSVREGQQACALAVSSRRFFACLALTLVSAPWSVSLRLLYCLQPSVQRHPVVLGSDQRVWSQHAVQAAPTHIIRRQHRNHG